MSPFTTRLWTLALCCALVAGKPVHANSSAISAEFPVPFVATTEAGIEASGTLNRDALSDRRQVGAIELVSTTTISSVIDNNGATALVGALSTDGRYAAFVSSASNLIIGDSNGVSDVFLVDQTSAQIERVSVASTGVAGNGNSFQRIGMSGDGNLIAFTSAASNLVNNDTNQGLDVFIRNRAAGTTELASTTASGGFTNVGGSNSPEISRDGRYLCFQSPAAEIVAGDMNAGNVNRVYRRDLQSNATVLVSVNSAGQPSNANALHCSMSADGRFVMFQSTATDLVNGDSNGVADVFVRDMQSASTVLVSRNDVGSLLSAPNTLTNTNNRTISADGSVVLWTTVAAAVPTDTNNGPDVYARNWQTGVTTQVSRSDTNIGMGQISGFAIADSGRKILFGSRSTFGLEPDEGFYDVFLRDLDITGAGTLTLLSKNDQVSIRSDAVVGMIAGDGTTAWWHTGENRNLVTPSYSDVDSNLFFDAFYQPLVPNIPSFARRLKAGNTAAAPNNHAFETLESGPQVSDDGRFVAFSSLASNLVVGDTNNISDVFVKDRQTGATTRISVSETGQQSNCPSDSAGMSADGRFVVFSTCAGLLSIDTAPTRDIYRFDRANNQLSLVSRNATIPTGAGNGASTRPQISADGSVVVFVSEATNLVSGDNNSQADAFYLDYVSNSMQRVLGANSTELNAGTINAKISPNARYIAFATAATNASSADTSPNAKVLRLDRSNGAIQLASSNSAGQPLNFLSFVDDVNDAGLVLIECLAGNSIQGVQGTQLCSKDLTSGVLSLVSGPSANVGGNGLSNKGRFIGASNQVIYTSTASNLGPANPNRIAQLFWFDGTLQRLLSTNSSTTPGNDNSDNPSPSVNGQHLVFLSYADNLVGNDGNGRFRDVYYQALDTDSIFATGFE